MIKIENKNKIRKGFTLVELLIVIAIIGILAGVVMVSSSGGVEKSKTASAVTSMSSVLPELVTCTDDGGEAKNNAAQTGGSAGTTICCTTSLCTADKPGHTVKWPDIATKTGYAYVRPTNTLALGTYTYTATKTVGATIYTITCSYANNECTVTTS